MRSVEVAHELSRILCILLAFLSTYTVCQLNSVFIVSHDSYLIE